VRQSTIKTLLFYKENALKSVPIANFEDFKKEKIVHNEEKELSIIHSINI